MTAITRSPTESLTLRKLLPARPEAAFRAWTTPELMTQWFIPKSGMKIQATMDVRVGGQYRISFGSGCDSPDGGAVEVVGEFRVVEPPRRLAYTWMWQGNDEWKEPSVVTVEFIPAAGNRTELVLTHERLPHAESRDSHAEGWTGILTHMAEHFAAHPNFAA